MPGITHTGSFDQSAAADVAAMTILGGPIVKLSGSADAINPHVSGNYIVTTAGVNAMTLAAPTVIVDDGVLISVFSDTTNAHTLTATSLLAAGVALKSVATFAAFRGAGVMLRAFNGVWQVVAAVVAPLT